MGHMGAHRTSHIADRRSPGVFVFYCAVVFAVMVFAIVSSGCSGSKSDDNSGAGAGIEPTPNFTPSGDESLESMVINTFVDNGVQITTSPAYIDFNQNNGEIAQNAELLESFAITNNSGATRTFSLKIYSVATGFTILDENQNNLGNWTGIDLQNGATKTFFVKFNAWSFGTQTSYATITADVSGFIRLPLRSVVTGPTSFKIIPTGYFCADKDAPTIESLDFYKVAYGQEKTIGIKICNEGGEDITINRAQITNDDPALQSGAMNSNAFTEFLWQTSDAINASFAFGETPTTGQAFSEPSFIDYTDSLDDPSASYNIAQYLTGQDVQDLLVEAGKILTLDVGFSPTLAIEAPDGFLYNPVAVNATLALETSLGTMAIPLLGATSGIEPVLAMSYRLSETDAWRPIDFTAEGAAVVFGTVDIFRDWVAMNSAIAEIKVENVGTGSSSLLFFGGSINGFFEYYWDNEQTLSFPLSLGAGDSTSLKVRYLPAASESPDDDFEVSWNFGQFYFAHNGGNGPQGKITLVGEQDAGYAVELFYGGSTLERSYADGQSKNLCVFRADANNPTSTTFKVVNNNTETPLQVTWGITANEGLNASAAEGSTTSFEVPPSSSQTFTVNFWANSDVVGQMVGGTLSVETSYSGQETEYASLLDDLEARSFVVPFQAMASTTGESNLCNTGVLGGTDTTQTTFIVDRVTMVLTDLVESAHNPPPFKFHLPIELNREQGTARISESIELQFKAEDINPTKSIRSYTHQSTNVQGCAPLPTNPYKLEYEKGSWTGVGIDCSDDGNGTITFNKKDPFTGAETPTTIDSDTACSPTNGGEEYVDSSGNTWMVVYQDFLKFEDCSVQYYGKISTFAYQTAGSAPETVDDVFDRAEQSPNESESFYEDLYGAYRFNSYMVFLEDTTCGDKTYGPSSVDIITDPDEIKNCYLSLASKTDTVRNQGFVNECAYFVFSIAAGTEPADATSETPDYDSWKGFGTYEPHVDGDKTYETRYDMTIYNVNVKAYVLGSGDRSMFFSHPGHLVYSDMYITFTTKRVAEEDWYDGDWQQRIAVNTRSHLDKNQVYLVNEERYKIGQFWTEDGLNDRFSNVIDDSPLEISGIDYGGYGRGNYRYWQNDPSTQKIIFGGWPINFDENNLMLLVGMGAFTGKGNTAPGFAKADASTGQGKPLYFSFHGCLVAGTPEANQGCFDYHIDDGVMSDGTPIIDVYSDPSVGMLPEGYVDEPGDCASMQDAGFIDTEEYDLYKYMSCINFKLNAFDRDRYKNYYDTANKFDFGDDPYGCSTCGFGN